MSNTKSKKSFGYHVLKLKQNFVQDNSEEKSFKQTNRKILYEKDLNVSTRITSALSSRKNSVDQPLVSRLKKHDSGRHTPNLILFKNNSQEQKHTKQDAIILNKNMFNYKGVLGKGGFGKVWKVQLKKNQTEYALKQMSKALIITKKSVPSVMNQKNLLSKLKHPFLVNMINSFQDRQTLYLIMDIMPGGDLRYHIGRRRKFNQQQTKFFIACILLALQNLHKNYVIHRDIKPQNIVFDANGYLRVTDLGIARTYKAENSSDTSGTPGYMAPEVMCRQNHSYAVDYFALGVIAYEIIIGKRPYLGRSRKQIRDQILAKQIQIKKNQIPEGWSLQAADFVNRLIQRKPSNRLGYKGSEEIKTHPWIRNFPWQKLENKQLKAPYIPIIDKNYSEQRIQISSENTQTKQLILQNTLILRNREVQQLFQGYQSNNGVWNQ